MTLLEIVQRHCRRTGLTVPTLVVSSPEAQIQMCLELLHEDLDELTQRHKWQALSTEATWTSLAGSDQGALRTLAPGIVNDWIIENTFYDRTGNQRFVGPLNPQEWASLQSLGVSTNSHVWRILERSVRLDSAFPAGNTLAFEYISNKAVVATDGTTTKQYFTLDDDEPLLDATLHLAGLRWRWKREQGLSYDEDFRRYEEMVANAMGRDGGRRVIDGGKTIGVPNAGITVPIGDWPL